MAESPRAATALAERWGRDQDASSIPLPLLLIWASPAVDAGLLVGVITRSASAGLAACAVAAVLLVWIARRPLSPRMVGARDPRPGEGDRARNLALGLARDAGLAPPRLLVVDDVAANAIVLSSSVFAVTTGMLESFSRTELEGAVAHCLARMSAPSIRWGRLAAPLGSMGARWAPRIGGSDDVAAAALTRYPPGLAAALEKAQPVGARRAAVLWFVGASPAHLPVADRMALLRDL